MDGLGTSKSFKNLSKGPPIIRETAQLEQPELVPIVPKVPYLKGHSDFKTAGVGATFG
jgi:hypothetical protein